MREAPGSRVDRFRLVPRDFIAGARPGSLDVVGVTVGDVICFAVACDSLMRDVQTNNATYGGAPQIGQQVAMSQLRAVEFGRPLIVAATTGTVRASLGDGASAVLVEPVTARTGFTLATRIGVWLEAAIIAMAVLALGYSLLVRKRSRQLGRKDHSSTALRRLARPSRAR